MGASCKTAELCNGVARYIHTNTQWALKAQNSAIFAWLQKWKKSSDWPLLEYIILSLLETCMGKVNSKNGQAIFSKVFAGNIEFNECSGRNW